MSELLTVILAAGKGTRMKSALPKVLHQVGGKPMVQKVLDAAVQAGAKRNIVVVGFGGETVQEALGDAAEFVVQHEQLGTGHAVMQAKEKLADFSGTVMVLCGDTPLLTPELLKRLHQEHLAKNAAATVLTFIPEDAAAYGRVIRNESGQVVKIVERKDASPAEIAVREVNSAIYCFENKALFEALEHIGCENAQGEYYLTDVIGILADRGDFVWAVVAEDHRETMGINSRRQLAEAERIIRDRKLEALMDEGVTIMDPASTFIDDQVRIGPDTIIYPFTWLEGKTVIGANCQVGPQVRLKNVAVGDDSALQFLYGHDCQVGSGVTAGPYVQLRPATKLADKVKIGNFVEIKNSNIGQGSKIPHLSYIGDTDMGAGVNMGCGCVTVNYDGRHKHRTTIEDGAFVGCNANLVAPVNVGKGAYVAAGSTITKDVPEESLGVARARQTNIDGWTKRR